MYILSSECAPMPALAPLPPQRMGSYNSRLHCAKESLPNLLLHANPQCADCCAPEPEWASVTFGTLICLQCAGKHRALGVGVSFVKSLVMDDWNKDQLERIRCGGNSKQVAFFKSSHCKGCVSRANKTLGREGLSFALWNTKSKYCSNTATVYRNWLEQRVEGLSDGDLPAAPACIFSSADETIEQPADFCAGKLASCRTQLAYQQKRGCFDYFFSAIPTHSMVGSVM